MIRILGLSIAALCVLSGIAAAQTKTTGDYLADGYEVKGVVNNEFLILQKGNKAFFCGAHDATITWDNWAKKNINAGCEPLSK
jgi:hypothetical protein